MTIIGIDHVQVGMPAGGEDDARRFYIALLGMHEVAKPPELAVHGGAWFAHGSVAIHLAVDPDHRSGTRSHPALVVDDLGAIRRRLEAAAVEVTDDDAGLGIARCYVRDPFGNRIELVDAADAGFSAG
jgi:catechol 2,3-dioxygenase-like lactoylglutathione lyase family enzyme